MSSETTGAIAEPYASALFELAEQQGALDQVADDLKALRSMIADSDDLRRLVGSPVMSRADQQNAILALAAKAAWSPLTKNFLGLAAKNRRLFAVSAMIEAYLGRLAAKRGEITAKVTSAVALSDDQTKALVAALKQATGSSVALDATVDPSLLGGLVVKVGSRMVDSSLKTKLQHLQLAMKGVG